MNREERLEEMGELADHIIGALRSGTFIPMSYVRRYNGLVRDVFGGEDPEIEEAKAEKHTCEFRIEMDDLVFGRDPVARQDQDVHYMLQKAEEGD